MYHGLSWAYVPAIIITATEKAMYVMLQMTSCARIHIHHHTFIKCLKQYKKYATATMNGVQQGQDAERNLGCLALQYWLLEIMPHDCSFTE